VEPVPKSVAWTEEGALRLLDQTRLPQEEVYIDCKDVDTVCEAIRVLRVRGAPAIGIAAAYGLLLPFRDAPNLRDTYEFLADLDRRAECLVETRPTAVNLAWAINRMCARAHAGEEPDVPALYRRLLSEARDIHAEDAAACRAIADAGLPLIASHPRLLTHCNAGSLAVSELGTALAPIYAAHRNGVQVHVFVDETRPLLQGARLTAWELSRAGVPMTLITDNMAAHLMSRKQIDAVIVGADRVAANGDVANKIGTLGLAVLCQYFGLPFYVACPWSTIDLKIDHGSMIPIEQRSALEVSHIRDVSIAPNGVDVANPAFDVTPADLVTAIITERGIIEAPCKENLATA